MVSDSFDVVLKSTEFGPNSRIYLLRSGISHTSFHDQQKRALALAEALKTRGNLEETDRIAIVGGGVAGTTLALALQDGHCPIDLYEEGSHLFRQNDASHRYLHPTINSWPTEHLDATTNLPFMNWYAGPAKQVVEQFEQELSERTEDGMLSFFLNSRVLEIRKEEGDEITLLYRQKNGESSSVSYSCIVVIEPALRSQSQTVARSYWSPDNLQSTSNENVLIVGDGDGALIDALRYTISSKSVEQLAVKLADLLTGSKLASELAELEQAVDRSEKTTEKMHESYIEAAQRLKIDDVYEVPRSLLDNSISSRNSVFLTNNQSQFSFAVDASPILKLITAYASLVGQIHFVKRDIDYEASERDNGEHLNLSVDQVVVRHGTSDYDQLNSSVVRLGIAFGPVDQQFLFKRSSFEARDGKDHAEALLPLASRYVHEEFGLILSLDAEGYVLHARDDDPGGRLPTQLFGVPVRYQSLKNAPVTSIVDAPQQNRLQRAPIFPDRSVGFVERIQEQSLVSHRVKTAVDALVEKIDDPEMIDICDKILRSIEHAKIPSRFRITFKLLEQITSTTSDNIKLLSSLNYLANSSTELLKLSLSLRYEPNVSFDVSRADLALADERGFMEHPLSGAHIEDYREHIVPSFLPGSALTGANA
jgi:hypothetical protein